MTSKRKKAKMRAIPPRDTETNHPICWVCERTVFRVNKYGICPSCEEVEV